MQFFKTLFFIILLGATSLGGQNAFDQVTLNKLNGHTITSGSGTLNIGNFSLTVPQTGTLGTAAFSNVTSFEAALGNPSQNGYVLSSTTTGTRSWISAGSSGALLIVNNLSDVPDTVLALNNLGAFSTFEAGLGNPASAPGYLLTSTLPGARSWVDLSTILDLWGANQGSVLVRGFGSWTVLGPGTSGQFLRTNGADNNPAWGDAVATGALLSAFNLSDLANSATARSNLGADAAYEAGLGNPAADGYFLSSTMSGTRSWIAFDLANITGTLPVLQGGTGQTTFSDGQMLIGNTATGGLAKTLITAGAGIAVTPGNGTLTLDVIPPTPPVIPEEIGMACSDETTPITTGTAKVTFRAPCAFTVTDVRASLTVASSSGIPTINIKQGGTSILSTEITIDVGATTSTTAAVPPVISNPSISDDSQITVDVDVAGTGATGLKVWIIGHH